MKKYFCKVLTLLLCVVFLLQMVCIPAFATENPDQVDVDSVQYYDVTEDSSFTLKNDTVEISDEYGNETDYISEVQISETEQTSESSTENEIAVVTDYPGDDMVYLTQRWLNQEYGDVAGFGTVTENGKTGWNVVYGLLRALQHELGITSLANSFGPTTTNLYSQNLLSRQDGVTDRKYAILQGALWCKGYCPGYNLYETEDGTVVFEGVFDADVEEAVIELKTDAGFINPNGVVTVNVMKALMSMDTFKLLSSYGGTAEVRAMQQKLNRKYEAYTGLTPCDGVYGRNTNKALVYALQAEELMPISVANGNFGNTTKLCCPQIPYVKNSTSARTYPGTSSGSYYTASQISAITELLQFSLLVNGFGDGVIDGVFDSGTQQDIRNFQKEMAIPVTGKADISTWMSLFISRGDTSRSALAADCATILTAAKAKTLYDNGYRYVGRYLTGTYNGGISKAITRQEAQIIFDAGLRFFPIYQTSANYLEYFTPQQGATDAQKATDAAATLGLPKNTIIYFAVDFDCLDYQITDNVIPYFKRVHEEMADSGYRVGIYGTRNACTRVSNLGYACSSFVGDMSTGFSGNLGFGMPDNWAFDQFATITIGSGDGRIEIDKDGYSGRDPAVSKLDAVQNANIDNINFGTSDVDTIHGPTIEIFGHPISLFDMDIGIDIGDFGKIESDYDAEKKEYSVIIGYNLESESTNISGDNTSRHKQAYTNIKTTISSLGNSQEFKRRFKDIQGGLYQRGTKVAFNCETYFFGYLTIDAVSGAVKEGGALMVGSVSQRISYPIPVVPSLYFRFGIEGSIETGFGLVPKGGGKFDATGNVSFSLTPELSIGLDIAVASAFIGMNGELNCNLNIPTTSFQDDFEATFTAAIFFEYSALIWGNTYEWEFPSIRIYPTNEVAAINNLAIDYEDLKLIEPIPRNDIVRYSNDPDTVEANIQVYCNPKIASLGNGKKIMLYISDSGERNVVNRSILMYRIYDGTSWSNANPVLDDLTADFEPYVYADGNGGAHIVWQNCKTVLDTDVSLDEMSAAMDLYYTYWNGTSFVNTTAITTNNTNYEMTHRVVSSGNNIAVVWQENSENDISALEGTNSIYRKQFANGVWQNVETIASGLSVVTSLDTSFVDNNNIIAYTTKTDTNISNISDMELFYYNGNNIIRITNDTVSDFSVSLLNNELYWIRDNSIVCVTNGDFNTLTTIVPELNNKVTKIKALKNSDAKKTIVWQQESDSGVNFYGINYNETLNSFGVVEPLTTDSGIIRGWDACMLPNGQVELAYGFAERLDESVNGKPYGQIDLIQKTANEFYDIYVEPIATYSGNLEPEQEINICANIYNNGSMDINQFTVNVIGANNTVIQTQTIDYDLAVGESGELGIPFTLPSNITKTNYTIQVFPTGQIDAFGSDNKATLTVGYADILIENVQENRTEDGRTLVVTVKNTGYSPINSATLKFFKDTDERTLIATETISQLNPNGEDTFSFSLDINEFDNTISEDARVYYFLLETSELESNGGNNSEFIYLYPDYNITLMAESGGSVSGGGTYIKGNNVSLVATPSSGYIFDGWYENGEKLYGISNEYEITVNSNRTLEARFSENDLQITGIEVFGSLAVGETISFTATATGGIQPWQWEFYIQSNNDFVYSDNAAIVNFFEWIPADSGTYTILAYVTDATGKKVSFTTQITIN